MILEKNKRRAFREQGWIAGFHITFHSTSLRMDMMSKLRRDVRRMLSEKEEAAHGMEFTFLSNSCIYTLLRLDAPYFNE